MDPGSAPLDPRLRDPSGAGLRPGPPATPTQQHKTLASTSSSSTSASQLPLLQPHPAAAAAQHQHQPSPGHKQQHHTQQQQQQQQQQPPPSHHAQQYNHHVLTQSPSPPYTHASHGSHGSLNQTHPQPHHQQHQRANSSSGPATPEGGVPGAPGDPNDPKKQRACESCRGLKVRCEPDAANPEGPCRRCAKAGRACVVTQPTRKRQKKTDNRVAELEKKIDALTASLQATRGGGSVTGSMSSPPAVVVTKREDEPSSNTRPGETANLAVRDWASQVREQVRERSASMGSQRAHAANRTMSSYGTIDINMAGAKGYSPPVTGQKRKHGEAGEAIPRVPSAPPLRLESPEETPDLVDRGILTMAQANELFTRYTKHMAPHLPCVVFPSDLTAEELRQTKPMLFHSVMAAASSEMPHIQKVLTKELMQIFADKVIIVGQKSLELVQALQVAVIWYWPPEHFEELKFYQLVHVAAVMAIDIGLGRKKQAKGGFRKHIPQGWGDHPLKKNAPPDPTTIEARRTWLACYFLATNTSMALHRPNLVRWTPFLAECVDVLESSPDAAPTDRYFCHLIWTHKLAEEVGVLLSMDDPTSAPNISDSRTQYALRGFERELERYSSAIPKELQQASLKLSFHVLNLYMHEVATNSDFVEDVRQPPSIDAFRDYSSDTPLTPAHINAISACLSAIDGIFEVFLSLDPVDIRCLPVFNFVRVAYAVVVLIKMYFAASSSKSELGKIINKDNMKVEQHLENLLEKFRATAADDRSRPAAKFLVVLVMLRSWFQKQKSGNPMAAPAGSSKASSASLGPPGAPDTLPTPYQSRQHTGDKAGSSTPAPPAEYSTTANTPLQLLSEVATNDSVAGASTRASNADILSSAPPSNSNNAAWYNNNAATSRPPPPTYMYGPSDPSPPPPATAAADSAPPPHLAPSAIGPQPPPISHAGTQSHPMVPWLNSAFAADFDYTSLGDDFAQAMDWTLEELQDGNLGMGSMENGVRYIMQEPPWLAQMSQMGIGLGGLPGIGLVPVDGMGGNGPPGGGGNGGNGGGGQGMYPF
ncbi:hypothetical protein OQA88_1659 [Cercophora sp. LCS_1]